MTNENNDIREGTRYPLLLVGAEVVEFKKHYRGVIKKVYNLNDLQELVAYYSGISHLDHPVVIDDISFINNSDSVLLKFVEESPLQIILLSYYDKVSPILLSRMREVRKGLLNKTESEFLPITSGVSYLEDKTGFDRLKVIASKSPAIYYYDKGIKSYKAKDRFFKLISRE